MKSVTTSPGLPVVDIFDGTRLSSICVRGRSQLSTFMY